MKKYGFDFYEWQENIVDTSIFAEDELTFSVLKAIVNNKSAKVFTDGKTVVICHSCHPYPVWVWVSSAVTGENLSHAAECLAEEFPPGKGYTYNLSYELLEQLKKENTVFENLVIKTNLLTYRCDQIKQIHSPCDGHMRLAVQEDIEPLSLWNQQFSYEAEKMEFPLDVVRQKIENWILSNAVYVWENETGKIVAMASTRSDGCYSKVKSVYTAPEERRKGYALHLVHTITEGILEENLVPALYTDADYEASNACYKKIGYRQIGGLCTVGEEE